jgi:4-amino-4-deoxy-L-arabinose transferase-like glycosyltransferase
VITARNIRFYPWLIFAFGLIIFSIGVPSEYQSFYIARFGLFVRTLEHHGISFFNYQYGAPYPDYIITPTLISYLSSLILGKISVFSCALPNIIVAALTLVFVYLIAAIHSYKWGIYAVIFTLLTGAFYLNANTLSPDAYLTLITTINFYIIYTSELYDKNKRLLFIPLLLIAGFAIRGPIGLIIPAAVVCTFYLFSKNYKKLLLCSVAATILLIICTTLLLATAFHVGGKNLLHNVISMQTIGRITIIKKEHIIFGPLSHLFRVIFAYFISLPLAIITIILFRRHDLLKHLIIWASTIFIGIAIVTLKHPRYFLAMTPPLGLLAGYLFATDRPHIWIKKTKPIFITLCFLLPYIQLASIIGFSRSNVTTKFMNQVQAAKLPIAFYKIGPDNFDLQLVADAKHYFTPQFIKAQQQFKNNMVIITYKKYLPVIKNHIKIIAHAHIRQRKLIAFMLTT